MHCASTKSSSSSCTSFFLCLVVQAAKLGGQPVANQPTKRLWATRALEAHPRLHDCPEAIADSPSVGCRHADGINKEVRHCLQVLVCSIPQLFLQDPWLLAYNGITPSQIWQISDSPWGVVCRACCLQKHVLVGEDFLEGISLRVLLGRGGAQRFNVLSTKAHRVS